MTYLINPYVFKKDSTLLTGLDTYYKFDSSTLITDATWNSNTWTNNWTTYTSSWLVNWARIFDWANDYIDAPIRQWTTFTFAFWFKADLISSTWLILNNNRLAVYYNSIEKIQFDDFIDDILVSANTYGDLDWHLVVCACDSWTANWSYLDIDNWTERLLDTRWTVAATVDLDIWRRTNWTTYFNWTLDWFWYWTRVLTTTEITELWNSWNWNQYPF